MLVELQALKAQRLAEEDYMGAHEAKERIQEQEKMLQARGEVDRCRERSRGSMRYI